MQRRLLSPAIVVLIVVFVLGIAFGQALNDNPKAGEQHDVRAHVLPAEVDQGP